MAAWRLVKKGVLVDIRLSPNASANRIGAMEKAGDGKERLKISVTAIPEKGKANKALLKFLAKELGFPQKDMELAAGQTDRNKTVLITGEAEAVLSKLEKSFA